MNIYSSSFARTFIHCSHTQSMEGDNGVGLTIWDITRDMDTYRIDAKVPLNPMEADGEHLDL